MPVKPPPATEPTTNLPVLLTDVELEAMAKAIGPEAAAQDNALLAMWKGGRDMLARLGEIVGMAKAEKPKPHAEPDGDEDEPGEGDDDGDEPGEGGGEGKGEGEGEGDDEPGYEDMNLAVTETPEGTVIEVSQFLYEMAQNAHTVRASMAAHAADLAELHKAVRDRDAVILAQGEQLAKLERMIAASAAANASVLAPMVKAVTDLHNKVLAIPATAYTPRPIPPLTPGAAAASYLGGDPQTQAQLLAKAERLGNIVPLAMIDNYRRTGRFVDNDDVNARHRASVENLKIGA